MCQCSHGFNFVLMLNGVSTGLLNEGNALHSAVPELILGPSLVLLLANVDLKSQQDWLQ